VAPAAVRAGHVRPAPRSAAQRAGAHAVAEPRLVCLSHLAPWPRRARAHRTRRTAATPRAPDPRPARAGRTLPRHLPDQHLPDQERRDRLHPGLRLPVLVPARWERDRPMASCWTGSSCPR